jgi:hypothetical protein
MIFAPFAFQQQVTSAPAFNPNNLSGLTFWVDMSNSSFYELSGTNITNIYSLVGGTTGHTLSRVNTSNGFYTLTASTSNGSLNSAKVTSRPTTYRASSWDTADDNAIVFGPKTNTTSFPDGSMFVVYNRGTVSTAGYLISRYNGSTDRGVQYNLATGSPNTDIIGYDFNSPAYQYYNTTASANVILTRVNNGATSTIYTNGVLQTSNAKNDTQNRTTRQFHNLGVYGSPTGTGDSTPVNTQYCEVIIYNRVLTESEINQVTTYLSNKWTIPVTSISDVTKSNLRLYLNAGNKNSYVGTGTAWNDLSGNAVNLTLTNGPVFNSGNGGYFLFDGTNDFLSNWTYGSSIFSGAEFTYQAVLNYSGKTAYNNIFDTFNSVNPMMWIDPSNRLELNQAALVSTLSYNTQNIMVTFVQQNANPGLRLYINDTLVGTVTTAQGTIPNSRFNFFRRETTSQFYQGRAYTILIYNRVLTATEITNNYNLFKTIYPI